MATIEERADMIMKSCPKHITKNNEGVLNYHVYEDDALKSVKRALAEQDNIALHEERERCIKAAHEWYCRVMCVGQNNKKLCAGVEFCLSYKQLRKAIEKGGEI